MIAIVGIAAVLVLALVVLLVRFRPNRQAAHSQKPHPTHAETRRAEEHRASGIN
jgi:hypothetical protein